MYSIGDRIFVIRFEYCILDKSRYAFVRYCEVNQTGTVMSFSNAWFGKKINVLLDVGAITYDGRIECCVGAYEEDCKPQAGRPERRAV